MKTHLLRFTLFAIIVYLALSAPKPAGAASQPSGGNGIHFCGVTDGQWDKQHSDQFPDRGYTRAFTANLNVGEPRTVRMIYFLPNDRPYRAEMVQGMKDVIVTVQRFFAEQMEAHGYGKRTFRVEPDAQGEPIVHRVDGRHPDNYYLDDTGIVYEELKEMFNYEENIYLTAIDISTHAIGVPDLGRVSGIGSRWTKRGGQALVVEEVEEVEEIMRGIPDAWLGFFPGLVAHELGHAFGLRHDFNNGAYIMSYGPGVGTELSKCHAEYLSVHPYFNRDTPIEEGVAPQIELLSPRTYPTGSTSVPIQIQVNDSDGLHQVILHAAQPANRWSVKACRGVRGRNRAVIEFDYDGVIPSAHYPLYSSNTSLLNPLVHPIVIEAVDMNGDVGSSFWDGYFEFVLFSEALEPLRKISGDNLQGFPNTPLPVPFIVEVRDLNDVYVSLRHEVWVTFTVTVGGGSLSVERVKTDDAGRAESVLTLGPNFGTNTVEVSAEGFSVTFNAVAGAAADIPDVNLRAAIVESFGKAPGTPIAPAEITTMTFLNAPNANINDLTGLEGATNLRDLRLSHNAITDISPLAGLTNFRVLEIDDNNISDISAVAGLTNLGFLSLQDNSISDISAVAGLIHLIDLRLSDNKISDLSPLVANTGLGSGRIVQVQGNPLSYQSIHTHIPILQNRGVYVLFDNVIIGEVPIFLTPGLSKISGDNQTGVSGAVLKNPFVIEVRDENLSVLEGISVTFVVTAGGGTLNVTRAITDKNGAAQSTLTLGTNLGTHAVSVSAAGIEGTVTFNAVAREGVFSPDSKLRTAIEITLNKPFGEPIVPSDMATLMSLKAEGAGISDLTGLEFATNLTELSLGDNSIWDISAVAELTQLTKLSLWSNNISDISAVAGLTNLTWLDLGGNSISDISPVIGLTNLTGLDLRGNNISDISAMAGLTQLAELRLQGNNISDISTVLGLVNLTRLRLWNNLISDLSPLVANTGLGSGDEINVKGNPLSYHSIHTHIPVLQSRGVTVESDNRAHPALLKIFGDNQTGASFAPLSQPFVVEAQDANGSVLAGISVTFAVTAGGGTLSTTITRTDTNGRAQSTLTLGPHLGANTVQVSAGGIEVPATFYAEGVRLPKTLEIISGKDQEGLPGTTLEKAFVVEVRDEFDKPLPGVEVTFTVTAGGGTVQPEIATTDEIGRAESILTLGPNPGTNTVTVSVTGSQETRTFNAEGSRIPKELEIISGADQEGLPGEVLEKPFVVEVRDQTDKPLPGVEVTFTVTAGDGTVQPEIATTDENGRAESTLTLGSTPGTNTVRVSVEGNTQAVATLTIETVRVFALSIPAGTHLIHIPLAVKQINGEDATIETVGDLYNALGDAVNFIITVGDDGGWKTYLGDISTGTVADAAIEDDTGLIVVMSDAKTLELVGDALGTDSASMISIDVGNNLVGVPLEPDDMSMISDLLGDGVGAIAVSKADGMGFHTIREPGQDGDGPIVGGVGYLVVYIGTEATSIPIVGSAWKNTGAVSAAPAVAFDGTHTPVLYVEGGVMDEFNMLSRAPELRVTVKNLSTGASLDTVLGTELSATAYSGTFVELSRHAAKAGDVLEIVAHSPNPFVGVRPVPQIVVSAEEVLTSRISLPDLELYEIPSESELLANYPNPFNPETWIPYRLAKAAEVTLDIYDTNGRLVRTIDVGFKPAAVYESRASAIYWDGRNDYGEQAASGVYFYHLSAGTYSATRKMLIMK